MNHDLKINPRAKKRVINLPETNTGRQYCNCSSLVLLYVSTQRLVEEQLSWIDISLVGCISNTGPLGGGGHCGISKGYSSETNQKLMWNSQMEPENGRGKRE